MQINIIRSEKPSVMELVLLNGQGISANWPSIAQAVQESHLLDDSFTPDSLLSAALTGRVHVWLVVEGMDAKLILLSQIQQTHSAKIFQIFFASGEGLVENLPNVLDTFDRFAKSQNCTKIEIQGRKGFERLLTKHGYEFGYVTYGRRVKIDAELKGN